MQYICREIIERELCSVFIEDPQQIKNLLYIVYERHLDCLLKIIDSPLYDLVRVTAIYSDQFRFVVIKPLGMLEKIAKYSDITLLELKISDSKLLRIEENLTRGLLLSPGSFESI